MAERFQTSPLDCTREGGAYILELQGPDLLQLRVGRLGLLAVPAGRYIYLGSAYGPGGLAARVSRHLRTEGRRLHWHIDYLTAAVGVEAVRVIPGGNECALVSSLQAHASTSVPFPGFGSSDCQCCPAHLLSVAPGLELTQGIRLVIAAEGDGSEAQEDRTFRSPL